MHSRTNDEMQTLEIPPCYCQITCLWIVSCAIHQFSQRTRLKGCASPPIKAELTVARTESRWGLNRLQNSRGPQAREPPASFHPTSGVFTDGPESLAAELGTNWKRKRADWLGQVSHGLQCLSKDGIMEKAGVEGGGWELCISHSALFSNKKTNRKKSHGSCRFTRRFHAIHAKSKYSRPAHTSRSHVDFQTAFIRVCAH